MPALLTTQTLNCTDMRFRSVFDNLHVTWHRPTMQIERSSRGSSAIHHSPYVFHSLSLHPDRDW